MSLTSGIHCPRTPLRRFLDRELSAGAHLLRKSYRARHHGDQLLLPGPGVGTEAGTVGTAIDYRLRLAFPTVKPVDPVAILGMLHLSAEGTGQTMREVGKELADRLTETVALPDEGGPHPRLQSPSPRRPRRRSPPCPSTRTRWPETSYSANVNPWAFRSGMPAPPRART